jgi:hypothetical protein
VRLPQMSGPLPGILAPSILNARPRSCSACWVQILDVPMTCGFLGRRQGGGTRGRRLDETPILISLTGGRTLYALARCEAPGQGTG